MVQDINDLPEELRMQTLLGWRPAASPPRALSAAAGTRQPTGTRQSTWLCAS